MSSAPASDKKKKKDSVSSSKKKKKRDHERTAVLSGLDTIYEKYQDQDDEKEFSISDQLEKESQDQDEDDQESEPDDDETEKEDITLRDVVSALNNMQNTPGRIAKMRKLLKNRILNCLLTLKKL